MFYLFFLAFLLSFLLTPLVRYITLRNGLIDYPKKDRWHKKPVALFGGIAIFIAILVPALIFLREFFLPEPVPTGLLTREIGLLVSVTLIFFLGLIDDIYGIGPQMKLMGQIVVASVAIFFGIRIEIIPYPHIAIPITVLWIVGITNAFNLLDNMDGLSAGTALISSVILFVFAYINNDPYIAAMGLIMAGSSLGFLIYNFHPASIFMGDSGSMTIGLFLGCVTLIGNWQHVSNLLIIMLIPLIVLAVPIFDTTFVSLARVIHGRPISKGGKDHTSHRLVALGLSERKAVSILFLISLLFGSMAIIGSWLNIFQTLIIILLAGVVLFFFGVFLGEAKIYEELDKPEEGTQASEGRVVLNAFLYHKKVIAEIFIDLIVVCIAYIGAYLLRYGGVVDEGNMELIKESLPILIAIKMSFFYIFGLYKSEWRYAELSDLVDIFKSTSVGSLTMIAYLIFVARFAGYSRAVFITDWLLTFLLLSGCRFSFRIFKEHLFNNKGGRPVLIYGAGDCGELLLREIRNNDRLAYDPIGFIDDNKLKIGSRIHGVTVLGTWNELESIVKENKVEEIIVTMPSASEEKIKDIRRTCKMIGVGYHRASIEVGISFNAR
ncbi:MAG: hypothetical protein ACE5IH_00730 [Thermodesulfobacteriota bacterium]